MLSDDGVNINYCFSETPFGEVVVAYTSCGICALLFADDRSEAVCELCRMFPKAIIAEDVHAKRSFSDCFREARHSDDEPLRLHLRGNDFEIGVWSALLDIPYGETRSYTDIASMSGHPNACRATGSAIGRNPVSLIVPCHRVIRSNGDTGNYRWGAERKKMILDREQNRL